jgi:hypothetical protein
LLLTGRRRIRIRHDLLKFGLLHSHRRALSHTNLLREGSQNSEGAWRPACFPVLPIPRGGCPAAGTMDDGADRMAWRHSESD